MTAGGRSPAGSAAAADIERRIARLMLGGTLVGVACLAIGVVLMLAAGISPTSEAWPAFDPGRVIADALALRPEGFLWIGLVVLVATPILQVAGELVAYLQAGEPRMALVATAILGIIGLSVALAVVLEA